MILGIDHVGLAIVARALGNMHNTAPFDATGNPALSVPCGFSDGLRPPRPTCYTLSGVCAA
ncbi:hypothetical protein [Nonomuraea sp. NPDC049400]|uniref:hypothetical protein n=1 Tax=Nonomuraea sp. NPDC049400 TaxID=3364352 RepID=UPI0037BDD6AA